MRIPFGASALAFGAGVTSSLSGLTIRSDQAATRWGGGISNAGSLLLSQVHFVSCGASNGGAIFNGGRLEANDCSFDRNTATSGGAIFNQGELLVRRSAFTRNQALARATDSRAGGGAFYSATGEASFVRCSFSANAAVGLEGVGGSPTAISAGSGRGGAIHIHAGRVGIFDSLIISNRARGGEAGSWEVGHFTGSAGHALGAGIYARGGALALTNCAIVMNHGFAGSSGWSPRYPGGGGFARGGGACLEGGTLHALNCTLSGNSVRSGSMGGGGFGDLPGGGYDGLGGGIGAVHGSVLLEHCTITENRTFGGPFGGIYGGNFGQGLGGGISTTDAGGATTAVVTLINTILSGNFGTTMGTNGTLPHDLFGPVSSLGHNLVGTAADLSVFAPSDRVGVDPRLGPLQDNGGWTPTHALLADSPAIDAGAASLLPFDQRGEPRPVDNPASPNWMGSPGSDIGALEVDHILRLTGLSRVGADIQVRFTTVSDKVYGLDFRSELSRAPWSGLGDDIGGTGGIVAVTNVGAGLVPSGFYRAYER